MPIKRAKKNPSAEQKPPSPPLSEKNVATEVPSAEYVTHEESMPPWLLDEDEEMPEETENTVAPDTAPKPAEYAVGGGGYNALKSYKGQMYSGMAVGGSHTWRYDQGTWKETKEEPDLWRIDYQTNKRRARNAPAGSGAPVGTEYHWLIVGHQHVKKIDANTYETHLTGSKYKLAYKSASSNSWSLPTVKKQRDREVELLEDAKQRVQGLPPVLGSEKIKVEKHEKGQKKLDSMFGKKRKADEHAA
ncbi:uncharacterized protein BO80DRAFT_126954 [Aspergillus ibericus CBS 121593]|uniref:Uncharacterized protein n=1 Tax=Aspergillus ibericus CBS 121593 TaxID=1448316 RepID=A0A395GVG0_9EURO|nr:hypothetical protein BO80DRAFT_126954 [Aspergillus ibericus CBS 121593]RAK99560.1 hypothetical protein BO80DRAFT_126954 [Aspergillus ibericus CBS 121593]